MCRRPFLVREGAAMEIAESREKKIVCGRKDKQTSGDGDSISEWYYRNNLSFTADISIENIQGVEERFDNAPMMKILNPQLQL